MNISLMVFVSLWLKFFNASFKRNLLLLYSESLKLINQENVLWRNWNVTLSLDRFVALLSHDTSGKHLPVSSTLHGDKILHRHVFFSARSIFRQFLKYLCKQIFSNISHHVLTGTCFLYVQHIVCNITSTFSFYHFCVCINQAFITTFLTIK